MRSSNCRGTLGGMVTRVEPAAGKLDHRRGACGTSEQV